METQFFTDSGVVRAVNGISFELREGETLGLVGESGCGKSVTALSIMRLVPWPPGKIVGGEVRFLGRDLLTLSSDEMRRVRGNQIAMIFQDPMSSLNPVLTVGRQITEALELHLGIHGKQARQRAIELLELVRISSARERLDAYPHHFSGGMRQRVMIAIALACEPKLLIADEPTTALDVTIQAQILDLMKDLQANLGMALILITHDLGVVAGVADRTHVMYAGYIVEAASAVKVFRESRHPYTVGLKRSIPRIDQPRVSRLTPIQGAPPDLSKPIVGCPFAPRCRYAVDQSYCENPQLRTVGEEHYVACWVDIPPGGDGE